MTVYVDDAKIRYRRMVMCHLLAEPDDASLGTDELLAMVDAIGVPRRWLQHAGTHREHFDICLSKRDAAIRAGAVPVTVREMAYIRQRKLNTLRLHGRAPAAVPRANA